MPSTQGSLLVSAPKIKLKDYCKEKDGVFINNSKI